MKVDFFASERHYADHLAPVFRELGPRAGFFFVSSHDHEYMEKKHGIISFMLAGEKANSVFQSTDPILVASHSDLRTVYTSNPKKAIILMEHGVGIVYPGNGSYAGNGGFRRYASLTLAPNEIVREKTAKALPDMLQVVIGTPKLDKWADSYMENKVIPSNPTVAISFHWDGKAVAPEAGTAFEHFKEVLPRLCSTLEESRRVRLIAHSHPRAAGIVKPFYKKHGIEFIDDFDEVMRRSHLYICDNSSTIYEFLVTGFPVIMLNSPAYRRDFKSGIRFWDYTDIGTQVDKSGDLFREVLISLTFPDHHKTARKRAMEDLFPHFGNSARTAARAILEKFGN